MNFSTKLIELLEMRYCGDVITSEIPCESKVERHYIMQRRLEMKIKECSFEIDNDLFYINSNDGLSIEYDLQCLKTVTYDYDDFDEENIYTFTFIDNGVLIIRFCN